MFLYVQNSQLKITPSTEEKREIKIHSNSNSLLNKIKLKQIKKAKTLHIWIFKDSFLSNYKTINDRPSIGFVNIQMPIMPIVVQQSLGSLEVDGWTKSLTIKKWTGQISVKNTNSALNIFSKTATVAIENYSGFLKINGYDNKLSIINAKGRFILDIFSGSVNLQSIKAQVQLSSHKVKVFGENIAGKLTLKLKDAVLKLTDIKARVKAVVDKGEVNLSKIGPVSINISSNNSASIKVNLQGRATKLFLRSQRFKIKAPSSLSRRPFGRGEQIKGYLPGVKPMAFLNLRTVEGKINIKLQ